MLALIAGQGGLPVHLARSLEARARDFMICEIDGFATEARAPGQGDPLRFRVEHLGTFMATLTGLGVGEVCFAGRIHRPAIDPARIDAATAPLVPRLTEAMLAGDDTLLRTVLTVFEEAGFAIAGAHEIDHGLLPPPGYPGAVAPDERDRADAARGMAILSALAAADISQSCVVAAGQALAVEALPGTDAMLRALSAQRADQALPGGGVLCKAPKPGQDRRIDLPAIGPRTIALAAEAGLSGVAIEAGGVMMLDRDKTIALADARELFLWVRPADGSG